MAKQSKCPCGAQYGPDPTCDICDGHRNDPDTGWGGSTDHFTGKHYNSDEERVSDASNKGFDMEEYDSDEMD